MRRPSTSLRSLFSNDRFRGILLPALAAPVLLGAASAWGPGWSAGERVVTVRTLDYAFQMPDRIEAGQVTIRLVNGGVEPHHVFLVRLKLGKTAADFMREVRHDAPLPEWAESVGGPNTPGPGGRSEVILTLEPGRYLAICFIPSPDGTHHLMKGMIKPFEVIGRSARVPEPRPTATVRLTDYDFGFTAPLTAGPQLIRVENLADQDHEIFLAKLAPGKAAGDLLTWLANPDGPPPVTEMGGATPIAPGRIVTFRHDVSPGTYALYCFVADEKDGKGHVAHGMIKEIKVGGLALR